MASYAYTFTSGDTVTPTKLNNARTVSAIQTADISNAQITESLLAANSVSLAKLAAAVQQLLVPAGAVQAFAMNSAPAGWLAADGTAVSRSTYASLFSAIGTTYGAGDGSTTFALPDLRGIFVRGSGSQTISGITYNKTFAAKEGDALQGHYHEFNYSAGIRGTASAVNNVDILDSSPSGVLSNRVGALTTDGTNGTPRTASETRPANIALLYCIKF
jgi:microcystin-dependent protein